MPGALVELLRDAPLSAGKVTFAWRAAVGSAVDKVTSVRLEHGILFVEADTKAWANELGRSKPIVLTRLQTLLGKAIVTDITVRARA